MYNLYFQFLLKCLLSTSLEKRISAMNSINDHLEEITEKRAFNTSTLLEFVFQNKIIEILLGENVHDELLKRSITLFHCLAGATKKCYSKYKGKTEAELIAENKF